MWDVLWLNAHLATMTEGGAPYGAIRDGALGVERGRIAWVGERAALPGKSQALSRDVRDAGGAWLTPGLIDCHTHLVYAGSRADEFEQRLRGASYEEIARAGGGIRATVRATRAAGERALEDESARRLQALVGDGVAVVEIKSGYGLDRATELAQLRVARRLAARCGVTVRTTFLGLHALPPEFVGRADDYVAFLGEEVLPAAAAEGLVDAVDAYCDQIAFTPEQVARLFAKARELGVAVKLHADQLSDCGGAALAARHRALSADHLEHTNDDGVRALAQSGTVAVLLPGAFYCLRETKLPPIAALRAHRVPIALATDCNPGTSPLESILLVLSLGCTLFRLTPEEALAGVTRNGARALGMAATHGTLEPGKAADVAVWDVAEPAELAYRVGARPLLRTGRDGRDGRDG